MRTRIRPIKLGIIGCGIAARELHLPALQKLRGKFIITAVCNHTAPKAKLFSALVGNVPWETDYRKLLQRDDVEAADIALPIHLNYQVTRDALRTGKHVFLEKPLAANLREAGRMRSYPEQFPAQVMMLAENFRYRPAFQYVSELLRNSAIGRAYAAHWNVYYHTTPENKYAATRWRRQHQYPGGFITDAGVHNIAAFRMWFGEIVSLQAMTRSVNPAIGKPDTSTVLFETNQGVACTFHLYFSAVGKSENRLTILGTEGTIEVGENVVKLFTAGRKPKVVNVKDDGGFREEFEAFYDSVRLGKPFVSTFQEGYRDLAVILGALRSAELGKKVRFT